ncbi:MAG: hypothetical protein AAFP20_16770 [Cyanobacteria bacterium J06614_10]
MTVFTESLPTWQGLLFWSLLLLETGTAGNYTFRRSAIYLD